jgi:hypothetical protein
MARKKKRQKTTWLRALLLFVIGPVIIWACAFVLWLYWDDLNHRFRPNAARPAAPAPARPSKTNEDRERPSGPAPQERIFDEDRKKLEEILKQRG